MENIACPECGAAVTDGLTCRDMLGVVLSWEWNDPELQAEHFQIVACYNIQHPAQFMDDAIAGLRQSLIDYLDNGISPQEIRRRASAAYEGSKRVLKPEAERMPALRQWPMTIADVQASGDPGGAVARLRLWGQSIRSEL